MILHILNNVLESGGGGLIRGLIYKYMGHYKLIAYIIRGYKTLYNFLVWANESNWARES